MIENTSPLKDISVLDVSRILAGPSCTQLLGDYGADIIKVERPLNGDDTRYWGPPFLKDEAGNDSLESSYYLSANRNKRSITINMAETDGQQLILELAKESDIFIENFKVGGSKKFGLDYESLKKANPKLIYCSISGFGQTGPYANLPGYDFMIQAMGGIMSLTGPEDGDPYKVGVGIADVMCGMYACTAILAALQHREQTGEGQYIDISLFDTQVAWLVNSAQNYLTSGREPARYGNGHPNIVPYEVFPTSDGYFALAVGNDAQFKALCDVIKRPELAEDSDYQKNSSRIVNRKKLIPILRKTFIFEVTNYWLKLLKQQGVPCGPVNTVEQVFEDPQVIHRGMKLKMPHPHFPDEEIDLIGNPVKFSRTPVSYRHSPPALGQHTNQVLSELLQKTESEISNYRHNGII
ncbi:MAG: CoA transferase [Gammaproteobacteria bacterium]|nr:CoA transferase [Gammaproteobacteria bacterium]MBT3722245.1 CoA transferase [Gammaproteobacteria bacterium]MBT4077753.1 CoA transferase [Gammaproteobacteria bacterium]MBT4193562.1 CoA transferase [Gammaproteobacteria bacterium]MBT4452223.1 CoA transferase [Gammaproteobacteria bacterium]